MNRRDFVGVALAGTALTALSGCKGFVTAVENDFTPQAIPAVVQQASSFVSRVGPSIEAIVEKFASLIPAGTLAEVRAWDANIVSVSTALAGAPVAATGASLLDEVIGLASETDDALSSVPGLMSQTIGGVSVGTVLGAIKVALLAASALFGSRTPAPAAARMGATAPSAAQMPLPVALQILDSVAVAR